MKRDLKIKAKTYNLYGTSYSSNDFFKLIDKIADKYLEENSDPVKSLYSIQNLSYRKPKSGMSEKLKKQLSELEQYILDVEKHIRKLKFFKKYDPIIKTSRNQYLLYMLEVELTNRIWIDQFKTSGRKVALIPHCLKDLNDNCKASVDGFDYVCKHCNKDCWINQITRILDENDIEHYLWSGDSFIPMVKKTRLQNKSFGMLGIACIPELINGMRVCQKMNVPVVGLPIDGNCCRRWWGETYQSTFNLNRLEFLLSAT